MKIYDNIVIATNLRQIMKMKNITMDEMSKRLGVCKQTISNWCCGRYTIPEGYHYLILLVLKNEYEEFNFENELKTMLRDEFRTRLQELEQ